LTPQGSEVLIASSGDLAVYEAQRAHELELNKATAAFEHAIVSALFLLNGGAVVAFLTLLGAASANESNLHVELDLAICALSSWAVALVGAAAGAYLGYRSQQEFTRSVSYRRQFMEHALLSGASKLRGALRDQPAESPKEIHKRASTFQGIGCSYVQLPCLCLS
jgi:hypothetical protein